jgi:hypothetical protein
MLNKDYKVKIKSVAVLAFSAVLAACGGSSDSDTPKEALPGAQSIAVGQSAEYVLSSDERDQRYILDVTPGKMYTVRLYNQEASASSLFFTVTDAAGNTISNRNTVQLGRELKHEVKVPESVGKIQLEITGMSLGSYRFELEVSEGDSAISLELNKQNQEFVLNTKHREHWFKFPAKQAGEYAVDLLNISSIASAVRIQAYDAKRDPLSAEESARANRMASVEISGHEGTVYLYVEGQSTSNYRFSLSPLEKGEFQHDTTTYEPNNTLTAAYGVDANAQYSSSLAGDNEHDWYRYSVVEGDMLSVQVTHHNANGLGSMEVQFHDENGEPAPQELSLMRGHGGELEVTASKTGDMYLRFSFNEDTTYTFKTVATGVTL